MAELVIGIVGMRSVDEKSQTQALERTPASPAPRARIRRRRHAWLHPSRYHQPLCRPGRGHRPGHRPVQAAASPPGVSELPQAYRRQRAPRPSMSTSSSTTTAPTSTPRSNAGSPPGHATISISLPPTPPGSTRSRSGSTSSPRKPSAAAHSPRSPNSRKRSSTSPSTTTTQARSPSCGPPPQTLSYRRSRDYVQLSLGHDTR